MNVKESISGRDAKCVRRLCVHAIDKCVSVVDRQLCEKALMSPPRALMLVAQLTPNSINTLSLIGGEGCV